MCECIEEHQREFMFHRIYFDNIKNAQIIIDKAE